MTVQKVVIRGIGSYLPGEKIPADRIDDYLGAIPGVNLTKYYRIIEKFAGIKYRHFALEEGTGQLREDSPTLARQAAALALERAAIDAKELDVIVTTTSSPPYTRGGLAKEIRLQLGNSGCCTLDFWGACTGIQQAITIATASIRAGIFRTALLVGVDLVSTTGRAENYRVEKLGPRDMLLRGALGDGAGAVVLSSSEDEDSDDAILYTMSGTEGSEASAFHREAGGSTLPLNELTLRKGLHHWNHDFERMVTKGVPYFIDIVERTLQAVSIPVDLVDIIIPAAANFNYFKKDEYMDRLSEEKQDFVRAIRERIFTNFEFVGNVPSAAIYLALNDLFESGRLNDGDLLLLTSVEGATWGWGSSLVRWGGYS
jgi:3-oxoacyl-[acyl-carrier-protein] synthase-3